MGCEIALTRKVGSDSLQPLDTHLEHAIPAHRHTSMYSMHKYWARKPANVVSEYIFTYAREGETVLDPFNGSGVTVLEAIKLDRKAIGVDVDPTSIFITEATAVNIHMESLKNAFECIKKNVYGPIRKYYVTLCPHCKKESEIVQLLIEDGSPFQINYRCQYCKIKEIKSFDKNDEKYNRKINKMKIPYWVPRDNLIPNSRINISPNMKVTDLFSHRNLIVLSIIFNEIEKIKNKKIKLVLKLAFTSSLAQCSKLLVRTPGSGPSWKVRGFWIPPTRYEMNVWHYFKNRFDKVVKGKEETCRIIGEKHKNLKLYNASSTNMSFIGNSTVDYIFTDPPYGDSVPYLELNRIWSTWLKEEPLFDDEIVISDSSKRKMKNRNNYAKLMRSSYKEMFRVLKPGKFMTVTFHNTDIFLYNLIIRTAIITGFELEKSVYQPPASVSTQQQLAPYGSAIGDYYIRFRKPESMKELHKIEELDKQIYENIIIQSVKKILAERGEPTAYRHIVNCYSFIYEELKNRGYLFSAEKSIDDVLKDNMGTEFELVHTEDNSKLWWFKDPNSVKFIERVPLTERIEKTIINMLNREERVSYDDILQTVYTTFPNSLTPDTVSILSILKEYAEKTNDKKWRAKLLVKIRISEHDSIVNNLCKMGEKCGLDVYGDTEKYRHQLKFKELPENLSRIQKIDVIWYKNNKIDTIFEVENTTGLTEALVRASNISYDINRVIVIPDERENLLVRKVNEPFIQEWLEKQPWAFIRYDSFNEFYSVNKRKKQLSKKAILALAEPPRMKKNVQKLLDNY